MMKLIKLELRQNRLKTYMLATLAISLVMLGFNYLFAFIPNMPPSNELEEMVMEFVGVIFSGYESIIAINSIIAMVCFSALGATALSRLVVSDYMGKRANLLFAYPIDRSKLFISKVIIVFVFTILTMAVSNTLAFGVFFFTESNFPLVAQGELTSELFMETMRITLTFGVLSSAIGLISLWFGFKRKSIQATLIPAYIMAVVGSNILGAPMLLGSVSMMFLTVVTAIALVIGVFLTINLAHDVKVMEAE